MKTSGTMHLEWNKIMDTWHWVTYTSCKGISSLGCGFFFPNCFLAYFWHLVTCDKLGQVEICIWSKRGQGTHGHGGYRHLMEWESLLGVGFGLPTWKLKCFNIYALTSFCIILSYHFNRLMLFPSEANNSIKSEIFRAEG